MGLGDLFKPKWKHSSWKKRSEAVKELKNQKTLAKIVENESNEIIRDEAFQKITDEGILSHLAKNVSDKKIRLNAVKKINDEDILIHLAKNAYDPEIRLNAVKKINDDAVLIDIIKNNDDFISVQLEAIEKVDNKDGLYDNELYGIVNNDDEFHVHRHAIKRISDEYLIKILKNTKDTGHFLFVVIGIDDKSLIDDSLLINIAKNSTNMEYAMEAIEMIKDKSLITDEIMIPIANNGGSAITEKAVRYIKDKSYLMKIARTHPRWQIRMEAYGKYGEFPDRSTVHESDKIYPVREAAEWRLNRLLKEESNYNKFSETNNRKSPLKVKETSNEGLNYCNNCCTYISKDNEYCPHCGSINITIK